MDKKYIFGLLILLILLYPAFSIYQLHQTIEEPGSAEMVEQQLSAYQLSIWVSWIGIITMSIYYKWTTEKNSFFYITYVFLLLGFGIFGFYYQKMVIMFGVETTFEDNYTFGVFVTIRNLAVAGLLTGFLQAAVWWFTRRWHRR